MGKGQVDSRRPFWGLPDPKHRDVATIFVEIVDESRECRINEPDLNGEFGGQSMGKIDIYAGKLAIAWVSKTDGVVVRPDANVDLSPLLYPRFRAFLSAR